MVSSLGTMDGRCLSPLTLEFWFATRAVVVPKPNLRSVDVLAPQTCGRVESLLHNRTAHPSMGEERFHIYSQVRRVKLLEASLCLRELCRNAVGIPSLDVDERAGIQD